MQKITNGLSISRRKFKKIEGLSEKTISAFGELTFDFRVIIWGDSGNGKSNMVMQLVDDLAKVAPVLYVSLEEDKGLTMQTKINRYVHHSRKAKVRFMGAGTRLADLEAYLAKPRTPRFVVIDSVQYFDMDHRQYKALEARFKSKGFIFISHAKGKLPDGKTADKIRYDAGIKVRVDRDIGFVMHSRYGGTTNYIIWEEGARAKRSTKEYKKHLMR